MVTLSRCCAILLLACAAVALEDECDVLDPASCGTPAEALIQVNRMKLGSALSDAPSTEQPTEDAPSTEQPTEDAPSTEQSTEDAPSTEQSTEERPANLLSYAAAWYAGPYGDCQAVCGTEGGQQTRSIECRSVFDGTLRDNKDCADKPKPCYLRSCSCKAMSCSNTDHCEQAKLADDTCKLEVEEEYPFVGCYAKVEGDAIGQPSGSHMHDYECMTQGSASTPCHSGLPFYRYHSDDLTVSDCCSFCARQGLDLCGIVDGKECRCSATGSNKAVWQGPVPPGLALQAEPNGGAVDGTCEIRVHRFGGFYEENGVPEYLLEMRVEDTKYVDSMAHGALIDEVWEEDATQDPSLGLVGAKSDMASDAGSHPRWAVGSRWSEAGDAWSQNWYGKWPDLYKDPWGESTEWKTYIEVPYVFLNGTDDVRKDTFRAAVAKVAASTCIRMTEFPTFPDVHHVQVGAFTETGCWATIGRQRNGPSKINLGTCKESRHQGSMLHEIGHVLGMANEQKRLDADHEYHGHGPHVRVHWENIPSTFAKEYETDYAPYLGSKRDYTGDRQKGYSYYDAESVMQYPGSNRMEMNPGSSAMLAGQRKDLSFEDAWELNDVYACVPKAGWPSDDRSGTTSRTTATTTTTTTPQPHYLEVRHVTVTKDWTTFSFTEPFSAPPIVVLTADNSFSGPATIRVKDVTATEFKATISVPPKTAGVPGDMTVSYMAALPGAHKLPDGELIQAGSISTKKTQYASDCKKESSTVGWDVVSFPENFPIFPVILAGVQTANNEGAFLATTMHFNKISLERGSTSAYGAVVEDEVIGFIGMQPGLKKFTDGQGSEVAYSAMTSGRQIEGANSPRDLHMGLGVVLGDDPAIFATQATRYGRDGGWARVDSHSGENVKLFVDEDQTCDDERRHCTEKVSVMTFSKDFSLGTR